VDSSLFLELGLLLERPEVEVRTLMRPLLQALIDYADDPCRNY